MDAVASHRLRRVWAWLWSRTPVPLPMPNEKCPVCQHPVVVAGTYFGGNPWSGPMMAPRPREELVAACPVHGRHPYNDASIAARDAAEGNHP